MVTILVMLVLPQSAVYSRTYNNHATQKLLLFFGFYNLFGPLHFKESNLYSTGGHINPIGLFYLIHSLIDAGFHNIDVAIDKRQSTSIFYLVLLLLPIKFFSWLTIKKEAKKFKTIDQHNLKYVLLLNSIDILIGRTIILGCKK